MIILNVLQYLFRFNKSLFFTNQSDPDWVHFGELGHRNLTKLIENALEEVAPI